MPLNLSFRHTPNDIILLSQYFLDQLYRNACSDISYLLDQDVTWVDTASAHFFHGYSQVLRWFSHTVNAEKYETRHLQYYVSSLNKDTVIVTGRYKTFPLSAGQFSICHSFQVTLVWAAERRSPRLLHIHISASDYRPQTEEFLIFQEKRSGTFRLLPEEILYVEAENVNSIIHTASGPFSVCRSISQMEKLLPLQFLRIHRSFIVNRSHVARIYRYAVELSNRTVIPVPEKKYMKIVCEIERFKN